MMAFKRSFTDPISAARERGYEDAGITFIRGAARVTRIDRLLVSEQAVVKHVVVW